MMKGKRRLRDGKVVLVNHNDGLRKVCQCPRRRWAGCPHAWHINLSRKGVHYRLSLDRIEGHHVASKRDAEEALADIRQEIRAGTFGVAAPGGTVTSEHAHDIRFEAFGELFLKRKCIDSGKASWDSDASMLRTVMSVPLPPGSGYQRLGDKPVGALTNDDAEAALTHVAGLGRARSTLNHYVQTLKALSKWAVAKGYRPTPLVASDSDVIRRKKGRQRNRRLHPGEEERLLTVAGPRLQNLIIAALESCCRLGELLTLQWCDVSLSRHEMILRAEKTKDAEDRVIPLSPRLEAILKMVSTGPDGKEFEAGDYAFGDETGRRSGSVKKAWQTAVLKAHGHIPSWLKDKGVLTAESRLAYRQIDLHFHDLRHEAGSRLLEKGWPLHYVQHMLGHANIAQTGTYLNATLQGMKALMRPQTESAPPCNPVASDEGSDPRPSCKEDSATANNVLVN